MSYEHPSQMPTSVHFEGGIITFDLVPYPNRYGQASLGLWETAWFATKAKDESNAVVITGENGEPLEPLEPLVKRPKSMIAANNLEAHTLLPVVKNGLFVQVECDSSQIMVEIFRFHHMNAETLYLEAHRVYDGYIDEDALDFDVGDSEYFFNGFGETDPTGLVRQLKENEKPALKLPQPAYEAITSALYKAKFPKLFEPVYYKDSPYIFNLKEGLTL